jgi:hypothetical protein
MLSEAFPPKGRGFCRSAVLRSPERKLSVFDSFPLKREAHHSKTLKPGQPFTGYMK